MSAYGLTSQQIHILTIIKASFDACGMAPSFEGMMAASGLKSKSGIHRILCALEERGHIHRMPKRARAIALGPAPYVEKRCPHCQALLAHPVPHVVEANHTGPSLAQLMGGR